MLRRTDRRQELQEMFFAFLFSFSMTFLFELDTLVPHDGFAHALTFNKVLPQLFCRFFFGFFWPSGASSGFPLPRFPCVFPLVLGWVGGEICSVGLSSENLTIPPANPPAPTAPVLCSCPLTRLLTGDEPSTSAGGVTGGL